MTALATPEDVRRVLAQQIAAGELRPGQRLGAERAMAAELGDEPGVAEVERFCEQARALFRTIASTRGRD